MSPSAADLITYIGVPLTIIGLLPIAYNVVATLIYSRNIKRTLRRNNLSAKLHSAIFNRVVEIDFPKYVIQSPQSTLPSTEQSRIAGGSWTFLQWDRQKIRSETQRTQPGDILRQPQAQIRFWDLIARLYSLGAKVDGGWSELLERPLFARGCRLMTLEDPRTKASLILQVSSHKGSDSSSPVSLEFIQSGPEHDWSSGNNSGLNTFDSITLPLFANQRMLCSVTGVGLTAVSAKDKTFNFDHLRILDDRSEQGIWFASCATALYASSETPILYYRVPPNVRRLAKARIIPHGLLDLLFVEEIPTMITKRYLSEQNQTSGGRDQRGELSLVSPIDEDSRRELEIRKKRRNEFLVYVQRIDQTLSKSHVVENSTLREASINWLRTHGHLPNATSIEDAQKTILSRVVTDQDLSKSLCRMLGNWVKWVDRSVMSVADFCIVNEDKATFAQASLLVVALSNLESSPADRLIDIQECADKWEYVELG